MGAERKRGGAAQARALLARLNTAAGVRAPLLLALSLTFGSYAYFNLDAEPSWTLVAGGLLGCLLAWRLARRAWPVPVLSTLALIALGLASGMALAKLRTVMVASPVIAQPMAPAMIEGWVIDMDQGSAGPRLTLDVHAVSGLASRDTPRKVRLTHSNSLRVSPGRFVRCYGVLRPPPAPSMQGDYDFQLRAWFEGLGAVGYVMGRCRGGTLGPPKGLAGMATVHLASFRARLAAHVNDVAGERAGGFAAALMAGDRSYMAPEDAEALRGSGLAHLLAISGLHMGIVGGLVYLILRRGLALIEPLALRIAVQKPAAAGALVASAAYLALSGASVSTQRAFIMAAIFFGAILVDRAALSLRSFALAMMAVVAFHPESVVSPGFQMSFAATGALIATYEAWTRRRRQTGGPRAAGIGFTLKSLVVTSLVAGLATGPFALYHFGRVASYGFLANLAAMPVITFVTAPLAALTLVLAPLGLSDVPLRLFGLSLEWVLAIAHFFSRGEASLFAPGQAMPASALAAAVASLVAVVLLTGAARWFLVGLGCGLAGVAWWVAPRTAVHWAPSGEVFIAAQDAAVVRIGFVEGEGLAPMRYIGIEEAGKCLARRCQYDSLAGPVTLHAVAPGRLSCGDLGPGIHLFAGSGRTYCATSLGWSEVTELGGQTLMQTRTGALLRDRALPCAPRPWSPCRAPDRPSRNAG